MGRSRSVGSSRRYVVRLSCQPPDLRCTSVFPDCRAGKSTQKSKHERSDPHATRTSTKAYHPTVYKTRTILKEPPTSAVKLGSAHMFHQKTRFNNIWYTAA